MTTVYFDMDGTIADLYGSEGWLDKLRNFEPGAFNNVESMVDIQLLNDKIEELQKVGIPCKVITWLPMYSSNSYDQVCALEKKEWLEKRFPTLAKNLRTVSYGTPKHLVHQGTENAIIFDDNAEVREEWLRNGGNAYKETEIIKIMSQLACEKRGM